MIELPHIQARVERLKELAQGLAKEVTTQQAAGGLLPPLERRRLHAMTNALAGPDEARVVLAGVAKRMEGGRVLHLISTLTGGFPRTTADVGGNRNRRKS